LVLLVVLATSGCDKGDERASPTQSTPAQPSPTAISPAAKAYLEALLDIMEEYSIRKHTVDWASFRTEVFAAAGAAQTIRDTHASIGVALKLLNDYESHYVGLGGVIGIGPDGGCSAATPARPTLPDNVGYVKIERTGIGQSAESIQMDIRTADRPGLIGWIVDLRGERRRQHVADDCGRRTRPW
jgi:hypothetical protein